MKKQTPNAKRRTLRTAWTRNGRIKEETAAYGPGQRADPTPNIQQKKEVQFDLEDRLLEFSARIIRLVDALPNTRAANHLAGQLLRSGTSPYGNHGEVEAAESRKDFVHKLKICLKELKETRRWLRLLQHSGLASKTRMAAI